MNRIKRFFSPETPDDALLQSLEDENEELNHAICAARDTIATLKGVNHHLLTENRKLKATMANNGHVDELIERNRYLTIESSVFIVIAGIEAVVILCVIVAYFSGRAGI